MLTIQPHSRTSEALYSNFLEQTNAIPGDSVTLDKRLSFVPRSSSSSGISSILRLPMYCFAALSHRRISMKYDAIIIGSGQAGNPLAYRLADLGWSVALIEKKDLGGTCINVGCTPT